MFEFLSELFFVENFDYSSDEDASGNGKHDCVYYEKAANGSDKGCHHSLQS